MQGVAAKPLTVAFHETGFLGKLNQESGALLVPARRQTAPATRQSLRAGEPAGVESLQLRAE
jgi:hypothetical protein